LGDARVGGVIDAWITPLRTLRKTNENELGSIKDKGKKAIRLAELNVEAGVHTLLSSFVVEEAVKNRGLKVHGVVYDVASGKVRDLKCGNSGSLPGTSTAEEEVEIIKGNHGMLVFGGDGAKMSIR
jgi:carbonic anhydrase